MTILLFAALIAWTLSGTPNGSFSEVRNDEGLMNCSSSAVNGFKIVPSSNYESFVDYEFHSDDQYIRCQKPIVLKHRSTAQMPVPFFAISKKMTRIAAHLKQLDALKERSVVVYAFSESNEISTKIASLMKVELQNEKVTTLENEPQLFLLIIKNGSLKGISDDCRSGRFEPDSHLARLFALRSVTTNSAFKVGLCYGKTWELIL